MTLLRAICRLCLAFVLCLSGLAAAAPLAPPARPTIVLVHGAFAESSSWDGVIDRLTKRGYRVTAVANPLRGVAQDADYLAALLRSIDGPVVLVGHSYGGMVISAPAIRSDKVRALVYVAAFVPDAGETALGLSGQFPGSTLGAALAPAVALPGGGEDLYIEQGRFHLQFAADIPAAMAARMASAQRPIAQSALIEPAGTPSWRSIPAWSIYGTADLNIPAAAHAFMAGRAGVRRSVAISGASHVVMVSHPAAVAALIEEAATAP
jgi:pimeloyl-ACP methyl ester carboxylesterase